jgi:hypothetical protein
MPRILHRRPASGFVKYPNDFGKRIIDGTARFRTRCDMLVGPCACGHTHQEGDSFVKELLCDYDAEIETINLVAIDGKVFMPRYWKKPEFHECCNTLVGDCSCGKTHKVNERWIVELLKAHGAKILGCETNEPIIEEKLPPPYPESNVCGCSECRAWRARNET